jgi:hypothetical protein
MFALFQGLLEKMILNDSLLSIALIALISGTSKSFGFHLRCSHRYSQGYNWFSSRDLLLVATVIQIVWDICLAGSSGVHFAFMGRINSAEITCSTRCGKWVSMKSEVDFFK